MNETLLFNFLAVFFQKVFYGFFHEKIDGFLFLDREDLQRLKKVVVYSCGNLFF